MAIDPTALGEVESSEISETKTRPAVLMESISAGTASYRKNR